MTCPSLRASYAALFGCGQFLVDPKCGWCYRRAGPEFEGLRFKLAGILIVLFILIGPLGIALLGLCRFSVGDRTRHRRRSRIGRNNE